MKRELLWISYAAPYDSVPHAGGKIENYYIKECAKKGEYKISLITHCTKEESKIVLRECKQYNIDCHICVEEDTKCRWAYDLIEKIAKRNIFDKYAGFLPRRFISPTINELMRLKEIGYKPSIIFIQWTQMILLINKIKSVFPDVPIICCEEDVSFQALERMANFEANWLKRLLIQLREKKLKKIEINALNESNAVVVNNYKDEIILKKATETDVFRWTPYFQNFSCKVRSYDNNRDIIFYGSMSREENWKSALWFINNVMPRVEYLGVRFIIVGANPNEELLKRASDKIVITGFVDDVSEYLSKSMCLVAPLVLGAGVKIKIIEGMSAGIPILTNHIGIEGIPSKSGLNYLHCETPDDYEKTIYNIVNKVVDINQIAKEEKNNVLMNMNYEKDVLRLIDLFKRVEEIN